MSYNLNRVTAVVLAGGLGTRIKALYPNLPKPMIPICGKPFLEWVIRYLRKQGLERAIISSGYKAEIISHHFSHQPVAGIHVQCVNETTPQGTAGGFLEAATRAQITPDAWLVLNGDSLVFADLKTAASPLADKAVEGVVVGVAVPDTSRYGKIIFDAFGRLLRFEEKMPGQGAINAGIYFLQNSLIQTFPANRPLSFEKDVFPQLLGRAANIKVDVAQAPFLDIGTPDSVVLGEEFVQKNKDHFA
jgi:D-glycero-alpha-D-manno-heptose 1-phosphate guanylyltransferase